MVRVDLRTVTLNIPPQEVITRDNVPAGVNAVAYFRVIDPRKAIVEVENFLLATSQISQTALRSVLGKAEFDQLLSERERLNEELQKIIDESTEPWGVKVTAVEIKDVEIPEKMQRAIARQAEAERERRAKIINSEGEFQAAQKLTDAADIISTNPASLQLRYLQTLLEIGSNQNTTVVFPLPMDMLEPFVGRPRRRQESPSTAAGPDRRRRGRPSPLPLLSAPEIRIDQLSGLRTILAPGRAERPESFESAASEPKGPAECPFCEGCEARTPPEVYAVRPGGGAADTPGWSARVVPNLYPVLAAEGEEDPADGAASEAGSFASAGDPLLASRRAGEPDLFFARPALGTHEVIVNAPEHVISMAELSEERFDGAVAVWRERMRAHADAPYVQLIVNEGGRAGASLEHTHAQLYALPFVPAVVARERERFGAYRERTGGGGLLSDVLVEEVRRRERLVAIDDDAALICPWASRSPYELRVVPRREAASFAEDGAGAAMTLTALRALAECFGPLRTEPLGAHRPRGAEYFHWHVDIAPRLTVRAGFELGTGVDINVYPPEQAAADLREALAS